MVLAQVGADNAAAAKARMTAIGNDHTHTQILG